MGGQKIVAASWASREVAQQAGVVPCRGRATIGTFLFLFDDKKVKIVMEPGEVQEENPVGCTGEGERWKGNIREGKTGTVLKLVKFGGEVTFVNFMLQASITRDGGVTATV